MSVEDVACKLQRLFQSFYDWVKTQLSHVISKQNIHPNELSISQSPLKSFPLFEIDVVDGRWYDINSIDTRAETFGCCQHTYQRRRSWCYWASWTYMDFWGSAGLIFTFELTLSPVCVDWSERFFFSFKCQQHGQKARWLGNFNFDHLIRDRSGLLVGPKAKRRDAVLAGLKD